MYLFTGSLNKTALHHVLWGLQGHKSAEPSQQCVFFSSLSLVLEPVFDQKREQTIMLFCNKVSFSLYSSTSSPCFAWFCDALISVTNFLLNDTKSPPTPKHETTLSLTVINWVVTYNTDFSLALPHTDCNMSGSRDPSGPFPVCLRPVPTRLRWVHTQTAKCVAVLPPCLPAVCSRDMSSQRRNWSTKVKVQQRKKKWCWKWSSHWI